MYVQVLYGHIFYLFLNRGPDYVYKQREGRKLVRNKDFWKFWRWGPFGGENSSEW